MSRRKHTVSRANISKPFMVFAASTPGSPVGGGTVGATSTTTSYTYGEHKLDATNKFKRWQQLTVIDPYVASSLLESSRVLGKGLSIGTSDDLPKEMKQESLDKALDAAKEFGKRVDIKEHFCQSGLLLMQDGNIPILKDYPKDTGIVESLTHLPMVCTTFLPSGVTPSEGLVVRPNTNSNYIMKGPVAKVVVNEGYQDVQPYNIEEVELIRNFNHGFLFTDILGRPTLGMYGRSLVEPIDTSVKYRQNILDSYEKAIMRYGHLKLWFDYEVIGKMLENHNIEVGDAKRVVNSVKEEIKKIKANEDIITSGMQIKPIETTSHMEITGTLEALEKTICNSLCATPSGSGKGDGNTFASAYMAEGRKVLVMESMRTFLKTGYGNILREYLIDMGFEKQAPYIEIKLDPIVEPQTQAADLKLLHDEGLIDDQQLFDLMGLNVKPQPKEFQDAKKKESVDAEKDMMEAQARAKGDQNPQKAMLRNGNAKSNTNSSKVK